MDVEWSLYPEFCHFAVSRCTSDSHASIQTSALESLMLRRSGVDHVKKHVLYAVCHDAVDVKVLVQGLRNE